MGALLSAPLPTGSILAYGGSQAPGGWLLCDGSAVSRTTYSALFAVIGTTYGAGDGSTTFNLPDLRGRFPAGENPAGGPGTNDRLPASTLRGASGGERGHTLSVAELPSHTHGVPTMTATGAVIGIQRTSSLDPNTQINVDTSATGGGTEHNNVPPYLIVNYVIKT